MGSGEGRRAGPASHQPMGQGLKSRPFFFTSIYMSKYSDIIHNDLADVTVVYFSFFECSHSAKNRNEKKRHFDKVSSRVARVTSGTPPGE